MKKSFLKFTLLPTALLILTQAHAATPVDLMHQRGTLLNSFNANEIHTKFVETKRLLDARQTLHVRISETYLGYPVWGADAVLHIPQGASTGPSIANVIAAANHSDAYMNGTFYQKLNVDLANTPALVFGKAQLQKALEQAIYHYQHKVGVKTAVKNQKSELIVYLDSNHKAHFAYKISFSVPPLKSGALPAKPVYIMDAVSFQTYKQWNDLKTAEVDGGGLGGNIKMGKHTYDGLKKHLAKLVMTRDDAKQSCTLQNSEVSVINDKTDKVIHFKCVEKDPKHNNVYWDGSRDKVNGGYSPANDALFGGQVIKHMYQDWYNIPVLTHPDGTPMQLKMVVHLDVDNAFWDGDQMLFGDGRDMFYPLTSIGVAAHEVSHGFTEQHSNLYYVGQSGGMNEAFSDMAAQAAEVYAFGPGKNTWEIGPEIFKAPNEALRYMYQPSKDCNGGTPGFWCSIDDASQYTDDLDVHFSSGVYNRLFYSLATSDGWDAKKAFDVMVNANSHYWTSDSTFNSGACGILQAATDLQMDVTAVKAALNVVKIDYSNCKIVG